MSAPQPKPGERWRVTIDAQIIEAPTAGTGGWAVIKVGDNHRNRHFGEGTWERLPDPEPEWKPGDLVLAADGRVWERLSDPRFPWMLAGGLGSRWSENKPERPLRRLVVAE